MATSNNDRVTSARLASFATQLWSKVKSTFALATALTAHAGDTSNPHSVTKAQVGLGRVPNTDFTSDIVALQESAHTHTNKTVLDGVTAQKVSSWDSKQDLIQDLEDIRDGASLGSTALQPNTPVTADTRCRITYDANGLVTAGADLTASDIPSLDADKITTGTLPDARIQSATVWNAGMTDIGTCLAHVGSTAIHVTAGDKTTWNSKQDLIQNVTDSVSGYVSKVDQSSGRIAVTHKAFTKPALAVEPTKMTVTTDGGTSAEASIPVWNQDTTGTATTAANYTADGGIATALDGKLEGVKVNGTALTPSGHVVDIPAADTSTTGVITSGAQTIGGAKTFAGAVVGQQGISAKGICDLVTSGSSSGSGVYWEAWQTPKKADTSEPSGTARFRRLGSMVIFKGTFTYVQNNADFHNADLFVLPSGYRPPAQITIERTVPLFIGTAPSYSSISIGQAYITINTDGTVNVRLCQFYDRTGYAMWTDLDVNSLTFFTD